jgi:hypothetical protein
VYQSLKNVKKDLQYSINNQKRVFFESPPLDFQHEENESITSEELWKKIYKLSVLEVNGINGMH